MIIWWFPTWFHEDILDKEWESYHVQDDAIPTVENKECSDINQVEWKCSELDDVPKEIIFAHVNYRTIFTIIEWSFENEHRMWVVRNQSVCKWHVSRRVEVEHVQLGERPH